MTNRIYLLAIILVWTFSSCTESPTSGPVTPNPSTSINKIMPLGASRVEGARPSYESYRYELWKKLIDGGWTFDYIGTNQDGASYPSYGNTNFDTDHEGRGGLTSDAILSGIDEWLASAGAPDIVLFSSPGGNDGLEGLSYDAAVANVNATIDKIQGVNPNVTIIIEKMAPAKSNLMTGSLDEFLTKMNQEVVNIATNQTTTTSSVITVDMFTGFSDTHLADDVHYNEAGAKVIATRYYDKLVNILKQ